MAIGKDWNNVASARSTSKAPVIIGFLTWRYGPRITNLFGGSQGAGVPLPNFMKRVTVQVLKARPMIAANKANQNQILAGDANSSANLVSWVAKRIAPGMKTSTVPGNTIIVFTSPICIFGHLQYPFLETAAQRSCLSRLSRACLGERSLGERSLELGERLSRMGPTAASG